MSKYKFVQDYLDRFTKLGSLDREIPNYTNTKSGFVSNVNRQFLDTMPVEEVLQRTFTPTLSFGVYIINQQQLGRFKQSREEPPLTIGFRVFGEEESESLVPIPYYQFQETLEPTTSSFFATEWAKVIVYGDRVDLLAQSLSSDPQTYRIYVLKDKLDKDKS